MSDTGMRLRVYWMRELGMADDEISEHCRTVPHVDIDEEVRNVLALERISRFNGVEVVPFPDHVQVDLQKVYETRRRKNLLRRVLLKAALFVVWFLLFLLLEAKAIEWLFLLEIE